MATNYSTAQIVADFVCAEVAEIKQIYLDWSDNQIERETGMKFSNANSADEYFDIGRAQYLIQLPHGPIQSLTAVTDNGVVLDVATDLKVYLEDAQIAYSSDTESVLFTNYRYFSQGLRMVRVQWTYGYTTVPPVVQKLATLLTAKAYYLSLLSRESKGATQRTLGDANMNWDTDKHPLDTEIKMLFALVPRANNLFVV